MNIDQRLQLSQWQQRIRQDLDKVIDFWVKNSHDLDYGGFFTCLDEDGSVFDENKYVWLQARQVWMYMRLYNEVERFHDNRKMYEAAVRGADFLLSHCLVKRDSCLRCPFSTTREGKPTKFQRSIFTECFFVMAMSELWRGNANPKHKDVAITMMKQIQRWCMEDDSDLGKDNLSGIVPTSSLAVPMMALCLSLQMIECDIKWCEDNRLSSWAVKEILLHVQRNKTRILENVSCSGDELPGSNGRLQIPGHAIECGWFLLEHCKRTGEKELSDEAITQFIDGPFRQGWDRVHGGLLYFIDADDRPLTQLEWNMKLWWPHNEAMVAFLKAFQHTASPRHLENFFLVAKYAFEKIVAWFHWVPLLTGEDDVQIGIFINNRLEYGSESEIKLECDVLFTQTRM